MSLTIRPRNLHPDEHPRPEPLVEWLFELIALRGIGVFAFFIELSSACYDSPRVDMEGSELVFPEF